MRNKAETRSQSKVLVESPVIAVRCFSRNTLGKSGRAILHIVEGEESAERLADFALGHLRIKIPQLQAALEGQVRDHHRFLLQSLLIGPSPTRCSQGLQQA